MNDKQADILKATAAAQAARGRLDGTVAALQSRLDRRTIARRAQKRLTSTSAGLVTTARTNPAAAIGVAVLGLLLVSRLRRQRPVPTSSTTDMLLATDPRKVLR